MLMDEEGRSMQGVFTLIYPELLVDDHIMYADEECSEVQQALLAEARHFGLPIVWGLTSWPDPAGHVWSSLVYRPIISILGCIPVGVA